MGMRTQHLDTSSREAAWHLAMPMMQARASSPRMLCAEEGKSKQASTRVGKCRIWHGGRRPGTDQTRCLARGLAHQSVRVPLRGACTWRQLASPCSGWQRPVHPDSFHDCPPRSHPACATSFCAHEQLPPTARHLLGSSAHEQLLCALTHRTHMRLWAAGVHTRLYITLHAHRKCIACPPSHPPP